MTVSSTISRSGPYVGAGTTGPFAVGFRFLEDAHLRVVKTNSQGVDADLILGIDFFASGAGEANGSVILVAPLATNERLTILRNVPATQEADYVQNDAFPAESHERALDKLTMIAQQQAEQLSRTLRLGVSVNTNPEFPSPSPNKVIGWDSAGARLVNVDIAAASAIGPIKFYDTYAQALAAVGSLANGDLIEVSQDETRAGARTRYKVQAGALVFVVNLDQVRVDLAAYSGAGMVGYLPEGVGAVATHVQSKLREVVSVKDFGALGDGITDDTAAIQAAVTANPGRKLLVPSGTYILSTISVSHSIDFFCERGTVFKRKAGLDVRKSYWNAGTAMFEATADGLSIGFLGGPTFDGNKQNQPVLTINPGMAGATTEPTGFAFKYQPVNAATAKDCRFYFESPVFRNGTTGYLTIRGDDVSRRFKTTVIIDNAVMTDTVRGYGKGDPSTPNALGWNSDYILVMDYVELVTRNLDMKWSTPTTTGEYAAIGIRATFFGTVAANSGEPILALYGKTRLFGLGRKNMYYNNDSNFSLNNGIGAIDVYGNGESLFCEDLCAENCENVPLRAKGSIKRFVVLSARLKNCRRGLQVSPSSTGSVEANIYVGSVEAYGGMNPQVEFIGTNASDLIKAVEIGSMRLVGGRNLEGAAANAVGAAYIRFCENVSVNSIDVVDIDTAGVNFRENVAVSVQQFNGKTIAAEGLLIQDTTKQFALLSGYVSGTGLSGVSIQGSTENVHINGVTTDNTVNYGVFCNAGGSNNVISNCRSSNVTGVSRGFHFIGQGVITGCSVGAGVATPLTGANPTLIQSVNNSFSRRIVEGTPTTLTAGTWNRGDVVWSTIPSAGQPPGWVCVASGTPGTWKAMANLTA